jgi:hypothetical protein
MTIVTHATRTTHVKPPQHWRDVGGPHSVDTRHPASPTTRVKSPTCRGVGGQPALTSTPPSAPASQRGKPCLGRKKES